MSIESEFFKKFSFDLARIRKSGVREDGDGFHFSSPLLDGKFQADLVVSPTLEVSGSVVETALQEPYLPLQAMGQRGAFVTKVREAYLSFLSQVAASYATERHFVSDQLCRLEAWIFEAFGERADYPFRRGDGAVFRNRENRKWYLLAIRMPSLGQEVIDLKVDEKEIPLFLSLPGFIPAYHMSKKHWISIAMDESVDDEMVRLLVRESRGFTCS